MLPYASHPPPPEEPHEATIIDNIAPKIAKVNILFIFNNLKVCNLLEITKIQLFFRYRVIFFTFIIHIQLFINSMRIFFCIFFILMIGNSEAQKKLHILFHTEKSFPHFGNRIFTKDSLTALKLIQKERLVLLNKGYLTCSIDSLHFTPHEVNAFLFVGEKFKNIRITAHEEDLLWLKRKQHIREKLLLNAELKPKEIAFLMQEIQSAYLNNGYPFVKVYLSNVNIQVPESTAELKVVRGPFMTFKKIHIKGDSSIAKGFLAGLLQIKEGDPYNESDLQKISQRLKQVSYINEIKPHEILYTAEGVELFVYVQGQKSSSANGIIGLQPNANNQKLALTGELTLRLLNVLKRGESLNLDWKSIQTQTQSLNIHLTYPYLFKTSFGVDGKFALYKRDTTFLELKSTAGVNYYLSPSHYIKAFFNFTSSNKLSGAGNNPLFTNLASLRQSSYGLGYYFRQLDYVPNPSSGFKLDVDVSIGTRKSRLVDSLQFDKTSTFRMSAFLEGFIPLFKRNVLRVVGDFDVYYAPTIYENETYRFGGLNSLRGFNEQELFATSKCTALLEYRFLLDRNSHVFAFFNLSWYENNAKKYSTDVPYGFGLGLSFGTKIGIFSVSYALGKQFNNPIEFRNGKIHFGYIAYF